MEIGLKEIRQYQKRRKYITKITDFKLLGKEICDDCGLTVRQSLDILNDKDNDTFKVLDKIKLDGTGIILCTLDNGTIVKVEK